MADNPTSPSYHCNFCGRGAKDVRYIIAGLYGNICNECVAICVELLLAPHKPPDKEPTP